MASGSAVEDRWINAAAQGAGFRGDDLAIAIAVALAESGGVPTATNRNSNGTTDFGLWQINSIHTAILASGNWQSETDNARMAYTIYTQAGNKFTPWSAYNNGRYRMFMERGRAAAQVSAGTGQAPVITTGLASLEVFTNPDTWKRVALFIAGTLLILIILASIAGRQLPLPITKLARKVS